ncbi:MAG TPA: pantoate--beta-alanine ligase [Saprospiraceae bacterium]|nr:pantoate--beta-alanine ligase [Saprospiraceae bacterium]
MNRKIKINTLREALYKIKANGKTIGFVPTMGALHEGHLSLITASMQITDVTVASVFVNPKQFNDPKDLKKYPRNLKSDLALLSSHQTHIVFTPTAKEIYPENEKNDEVNFSFNGLDTLMEGKYRPGHFKGVVQVVNKLLNIVEPDHLFMGQKDFQQLTIIRHMIKMLSLPVKLHSSPTIRENTGLAMSSRNVRLSHKTRAKACIIYHTLSEAKKSFHTGSPDALQRLALEKLTIAPFRPEYFEIVDGFTLQPVTDWNQHDFIVACTAVRVEGIRLIDNIILKDLS